MKDKGERRREAVLWLRRVRAMTVKEFLQLFRDAVLMAFLLYAFTVDIYLAASGVTLELKETPFVVHDADHSRASRELVRRFRPPYFKLEGEIHRMGEGVRLLEEGEAMMVLDIPPRFQERILEGEAVDVQLQVDTSNSVLGLLAADYSGQIAAGYSRELALSRLDRSLGERETVPQVEARYRVWFNPGRRDAWFMSISELLNVTTLFSILLPAVALVREKERGTAEQLLVSPLSPFQIVFPKVLAMASVIVAGTVLSVFGILKPFFDLPLRGSLPLFWSITILYVLAMAGVGLVASTMTRNLAQVGLLTILIFAPLILLSGAWTPPEAMPEWLRIVSRLSPLYHYIDVSHGILVKGAPFGVLWDAVLAIAVLGSLIFVFGLRRFRRQFR